MSTVLIIIGAIWLGIFLVVVTLLCIVLVAERLWGTPRMIARYDERPWSEVEREMTVARAQATGTLGDDNVIYIDKSRR